MARKKTRKPKLARLLDQSDEVIAVVDSDFEVLYANAACCDWLGVGSGSGSSTGNEESLVSTTLRYSTFSAAKAGSGQANGICPPPQIFESSEPGATGAVYATRSGRIVWKKASFAKITDSSFPLQSILIVAGGPDLDQPPTDDSSDCSQLHLVLSELKKQQQSLFSASSLIGQSAAAKKTKRQLDAMVANDADCLIVGPDGCGKEHLARTIFYERIAARRNPAQSTSESESSGVAGVDLIPIHCSIADSQHIQNSIKEWAFEQRSKRTTDWLLLLDIDQLTTEAQVELLGYVQMPDFEIRVLATAKQDLEALTEAGQFNAELASYLSVQIIQLQPLNKRPQDIPLLTQYFVEQGNRSSNRQINGCTDAVIEEFCEYHWPRNIDELAQTIGAAHANASSALIDLADLPDAFRHGLSATRIGSYEPTVIDLEEYLRDIEGQLIQRALNESRNNKTKAAGLLTISRAKLLRRAAALGIIKPPEKPTVDVVDESAFKIAEDEPETD